MKISKLIKELEKFKNLHGDAEVLTRIDGFGGYGIHNCGGISEDQLYPSEFYEGGEDGNVTDTTIKELFPEWNGDHETLDNMNPITCVVINNGHPLYSS
jgi:hypothetical protein